MKREELDKIIAEAPAKVSELLGDLHPKIMEAAAATLTETQDSETGKATLKVSFSLAIELHCCPVAWTLEAAVGVRYKVKTESEVADTSPELAPDMGKSRKAKSTSKEDKP